MSQRGKESALDLRRISVREWQKDLVRGVWLSFGEGEVKLVPGPTCIYVNGRAFQKQAKESTPVMDGPGTPCQCESATLAHSLLMALALGAADFQLFPTFCFANRRESETFYP